MIQVIRDSEITNYIETQLKKIYDFSDQFDLTTLLIQIELELKELIWEYEKIELDCNNSTLFLSYWNDKDFDDNYFEELLITINKGCYTVAFYDNQEKILEKLFEKPPSIDQLRQKIKECLNYKRNDPMYNCSRINKN